MATSDSPLSVPNITLAVARQAGPVTGGPVGDSEPDLNLPAGNIVSDDFASGDLESPGSNGFDWGGSGNQRYTSLVTMDPATGDPTVVFTSGGAKVYNVISGDPRDWTALHGDNSLRFAYNLGTDPNVFSEQRWALSGRSEPALWARWALRVPTNFTHENLDDVYGEPHTPTSNNKLFYFWMDSYGSSRTGTILGMEFRPDGSGGSVFYPASGGSLASSRPFISVPGDRGRWMYLAMRLAAESSPGAGDGSFELWRKWAEAGSAWTKEFEVLNKAFNLPTDGTFQGWSAGYLMGADNSGYAEDTEFLIDDFNLSTESLL